MESGNVDGDKEKRTGDWTADCTGGPTAITAGVQVDGIRLTEGKFGEIGVDARTGVT
jgi:hypothetical protein